MGSQVQIRGGECVFITFGLSQRRVGVHRGRLLFEGTLMISLAILFKEEKCGESEANGIGREKNFFICYQK